MTLTYAHFRTLALSFVVFLFTVLSVVQTQAHEMNPAIVDARLLETGKIVFTADLNLEAMIAEIPGDMGNTDDAEQVDTYIKLRLLESDQLTQQAELWLPTFLNNIAVSGDQPINLIVTELNIPPMGDVELPRTSQIIFSTVNPVIQPWQFFWPPAYGDVAFRFSTPDVDDVVTEFLTQGGSTAIISMSEFLPESGLRVFVNYIGVGIDHIVPKGLDHILFVVGLFLFSSALRPLLLQVSAFTAAHTLTLGLSMAGLVNVSSAVVEPLIALSIVYVAVENVFLKTLHWWRPALIFGFGLLHGLGFATVLTEFGLSSSVFLPGLIGFNVGVEVGQLMVIAVCFSVLGYWFGQKSWYRSRITRPLSVIIALIGLYWFVERVFF